MSKTAAKTDKNKSSQRASPGQLLRRARDARKLSVESIAERLHLSVDIIQALENAAYDQLPAPTYVRGYLRSYAIHVGIDGDKLVEEYNQVAGELPPDLVLDVMPSASRPGRKPEPVIVIMSVVVVAALLALIGWLSSSDEPQRVAGTTPDQQVQQIENTEHRLPEENVVAIVAPTGESINKTEQTGVPATNNAVPEEMPAPEPAQPTATETEIKAAPVVEINSHTTEPEAVAIVEQQSPVADAAATPDQKELRLSLAFDGQSWVEIYDANNKRLMMRLARAGSRYNVTGKAPLHVLLGNAQVVRLMVNDQAFSHQAYIRGKVARFNIPAQTE